MTLKVYTVKSNARRDARKLGVDPMSVVAESGGWVIGALRTRMATNKQARLQQMLEGGWLPLPHLSVVLGWQHHTVRGVISRIGKLPGLTVERRRDAGILSYRVVRS